MAKASFEEQVERLNRSAGIGEEVGAESAEPVLYQAACTLLYSSSEQVVGASPRRMRQRRGVLVLTERRVVFRAGFLTPLSVFWLLVLAGLVARVAWTGELERPVLLLVPALFLLQRLPHRIDRPYADFGSCKVATVQGLVSSGIGLILELDQRFLHFTVLRPLPADLEARFLR
ncbi:MAG: hypothetical protein H8E31_09515 [Planctomycetes bacterium]|nr:hypothetical protein [Planctomycetota bacterium]